MIDNEDIPTTPRPIPEAETQAEAEVDQAETKATISVPTEGATQSPPPAPSTTPSLPGVSVDDLLALRLVSDPQISPNGESIAFTVQHNQRETNTTGSAIWLVNARGGKNTSPRQLTGGTAHNFAPRWSPDGQTLAFLSTREGAPQIYLLTMNGGEAHRLTNLNLGVIEYSWRPDGSALLAHSGWKPSDDQEIEDTSAIATVHTRLDEYWDGAGYKQGRHQQLWLIPLESEATRITSEPVDLMQSCWSPDGTEIAFCANRRSDSDLSFSMSLWVLTLATGHIHRLTSEEGLAQMPSWSPDGQYIACYYSPDQTEASNFTPWIITAHGNDAPRPASQATQDVTCLTFIIDELHAVSLTSPQWYPDNRSLLIPVQERGQVHLYRVDIQDEKLTQLTSGNGCYLSPQLSKNGQVITLVRTDWFTPGDVWTMESSGENPRKLTGVNDAFLRSHQLVRPKRITWPSFDGLEIEGWLYLPPLAEGTKAPLILEVHGGPTLAWGDSYVHEFQVLAGRGYAVLAANPRGSSGYGEEFCKKILGDWGGDDMRDLLAGIDHVIATEPVDGERIGIGGISYGGYMTNWMLTQSNRFKAGVSRNSISNLNTASLISDQARWFDLALGDNGQDREAFRGSRSAISFAEKITAPLLLLHAENDLRCPIEESIQLFVSLRKRKHIVELVRYPGVSHMMDWPDVGTPRQRIDRLRRTVDWFARFV